MKWSQVIGPIHSHGPWVAAIAYARTLEVKGKYRDVLLEVSHIQEKYPEEISAVTIRIRIHYAPGQAQKGNATNLWMHGATT